MKMKKYLSLIVSLLTACSLLAGCGSSGAAEAGNAEADNVDSGSGAAAAEGDAGSLEDALNEMKDLKLNWAISMGSSHKVNEIFQ